MDDINNSQGRVTLHRARRDHCGFLTEADIAIIAGDPATRLTMLLVRCGGGRFLAPAQDVRHFCEIIEASAEDYIRDVSIPADSRRSGR